MKLVYRLGIAIVLGAAPVSAQVQFYPWIAAEANYSDNVTYTGTTGIEDTAYVLSAELPVARTWRTGDLQFRYSPSLYRYRDFSELDRADHDAAFSVRSDLSRRNSFSFDTRFSSSQAQGNFDTANPDIILTQRTDRERFDASLNFNSQVSRLWGWNAGAEVGSVDHDPIPGFPALGLPVEDRAYTRFSTGFDRTVSAKTSVGLNLSFQETRLEVNGDEDVRNASLYVARRVGERSALNFELGAFDAESMVSDRSGAFFRLAYQRDYNRVALVSFITHRPTTGGNLPGTATETHAGVSIRSMGFRKWSWSLAGFYAERDPADPSRPETDSAGMDGQATWAIHPKFGLRWTAASVRQSDPALDADVFRAAFGIVWFPKGRERRKQG